MKEYHFQCPYCWQTISVSIDTSVERQTYIEDCEVCCQPIEIAYYAQDGAVVSLQAERIQ